MNYSRSSLQYAREQDRKDPLRSFRSHFQMDDPHIIYLDGNSLGRLPLKTIGHMQEVIEKQWGNRLIRSWNDDWIGLTGRLSRKIASLVGASQDEILVGDSTSVNLYKLVIAALQHQEHRHIVISDNLNFPSDLYVLQGAIHLLGSKHELKLVESEDGIGIDPERIEQLIDKDTALLTLSHAAFKSAYLYDMEKITGMAHKKGALMLWDLSHSVGSVPVDLNRFEVDLAIGCTYKYLNGGPGAPAFLYIRKDLQEKLTSPIWGWFGSERQFDFDLKYQPAAGVQKFAAGTPGILSMAALEPALDIHLQAGMGAIREKSILQTEYVKNLAEVLLTSSGFVLGSPSDPSRRGSHISLKHPEGYRICQALIQDDKNPYQVIPDFRLPDNIRLGIAPLYTTFEELYHTITLLADIVSSGRFMNFSDTVSGVT